MVEYPAAGDRRPAAPPGPARVQGPTVPVTSGAEGPATVVTFSTTYGREGPEWTALICDLPDGSRAYARLRPIRTTTTWPVCR